MNKSASLKQGIWVLIGLAVLSGVEYLVAITQLQGGMPVLVFIALAKTALILIAFMHVDKVFQDKEEDHS